MLEEMLGATSSGVRCSSLRQFPVSAFKGSVHSGAALVWIDV